MLGSEAYRAKFQCRCKMWSPSMRVRMAKGWLLKHQNRLPKMAMSLQTLPQRVGHLRLGHRYHRLPRSPQCLRNRKRVIRQQKMALTMIPIRRKRVVAQHSLVSNKVQYRSSSVAGLAHLVEHMICNHGVAGSSPAAGTNTIKGHFSYEKWPFFIGVAFVLQCFFVLVDRLGNGLGNKYAYQTG
jgi:hypothetical protein